MDDLQTERKDAHHRSLPFRRSALGCKNATFVLNGRYLLKDVNFLVEPGQFVAVVGPSGAGKTTLLNALTGRKKLTSGVPQLIPESTNDTITVAPKCSYVMVDARLLPYLTARETLQAAADLRLPHLTREQRVAAVEAVESELGLTRCRHTLVGGDWRKGLSTGERKRLNIAIELLASPCILVLDEPTSGLDSTLACELLIAIRKLCAAGRAVICTIHQPTSQMFALFDQLCVLANGSIMYYGPASEASTYFDSLGYPCPKNFNMADHLLRIVSPPFDSTASDKASDEDTTLTGTPSKATTEDDLEAAMGGKVNEASTVADVDRLATTWKESSRNKDLGARIDKILMGASDLAPSPLPPNEESIIGGESFTKRRSMNPIKLWLMQVSVLTRRSFLNSIRNPVSSAVILLVQALQGIILGGMFLQVKSPVRHDAMFTLDTHKLLMNDWTQLLVSGLANRQPIIEALEHGVDGAGSQPLLDFLDDTKFQILLQDWLACATDKINVPWRFKYPQYAFPYPPTSLEVNNAVEYNSFTHQPTAAKPIRPWEGSEALSAQLTVPAMLGVIQMIDFNWLQRDWDVVKEAVKDLWGKDQAVDFWTTVTGYISEAAINPVFFCGGYPEYPVNSWDNTGEKLQFDQLRRSLMSFNGGTGLVEALNDIVGPAMGDAYKTAGTVLKSMRKCDHKGCKWIDKRVQKVADLGNDTYAAVMVLINLLGALFFLVANLGFSSFDALLTFPQERLLFNRENASGLYHSTAYFVAKNLADCLFQIVPSVILTTVFYLLTGLGGTASQYFVYLLITIDVCFAAYGFGYLVSALSPRMEVAVLAAPVILTIWLTIAGFFLRDEQIPVWIRWLAAINFYKWGFFSFVTNEFRKGGHLGILSNTVAHIAAGVTEHRLHLTMLYVFFLGLGYRIAAFFALKYTNRRVGLTS